MMRYQDYVNDLHTKITDIISDERDIKRNAEISHDY